MAIYRGAGGAGDATNDATSQSILAAQSAQEAAASEAAAASSASNASTSATNAASSAIAAASSATSAANSASSAATQAANAASSAATATTKAAEAADSATAAASSATAAATSATNASNSATAAANSATSASNSASAASTSASNAATYASNAATSATNAAASETNAAASADSASNSATSATASATSAGNSASSATTSATNAANSASAAATSASNAATSATNASNSATSASTSATNAANSATSASTSATNAANSATAAAASYDSFDDRYLGSKTSNPTLDNDGNALLTGALYWNSTVGEMRVYNGSAWVAAYVPAATYVAKAGDVMTGSLEVPTQASLKATTLTRASIRPSLLLDFANTKQLDPRITFSRPTTATYYDGKTVVKAEENLLKYSQDFKNDWGTSNATTIANATIAPDGTTTATSIIPNTTAAVSHGIVQTSGVAINTQYTISVYAKSNGYTNIQFYGDFSGNFTATFDLTAVTAAYGGSATSATITSVGNGWYRCVATFTMATSSRLNIQGFPTGATASNWGNTFAGDGTSGIYLWGAQLEQRSTVTAYTPTTTAPITNYIPVLQTAVSNDARFDHDPVTGESKGLLIEEQRTNLLTYSDGASNAAWTKSNATITADTIIAPDGTLTGDLLTASSTSAAHAIYGTAFSITSGSSYTASVYVKSYGVNYVSLRGQNAVSPANYPWITVNLSTGSIAANGAVSSSSATNVGNNWWRISLTWTADATVTSSSNIVISTSDVSTAPATSSTLGNSYTGNGYSGIYIWGAQLEAGSFPTSYIPTVASQVTRSADSASMTGSNFSSWYRADEGTLYGEFTNSGFASGVTRVLGMSDGTPSNRVRLFIQSATQLRSTVNAVGVEQALLDSVISTVNIGSHKVSVSYKVNDFAQVADSGVPAIDTSGQVPQLNMLGIGQYEAGGSNYLNGTIKRIAFWPKRLSNTELQGLTS